MSENMQDKQMREEYKLHSKYAGYSSSDSDSQCEIDNNASDTEDFNMYESLLQFDGKSKSMDIRNKSARLFLCSKLAFLENWQGMSVEEVESKVFGAKEPEAAPAVIEEDCVYETMKKVEDTWLIAEELASGSKEAINSISSAQCDLKLAEEMKRPLHKVLKGDLMYLAKVPYFRSAATDGSYMSAPCPEFVYEKTDDRPPIPFRLSKIRREWKPSDAKALEDSVKISVRAEKLTFLEHRYRYLLNQFQLNPAELAKLEKAENKGSDHIRPALRNIELVREQNSLPKIQISPLVFSATWPGGSFQKRQGEIGLLDLYDWNTKEKAQIMNFSIEKYLLEPDCKIDWMMVSQIVQKATRRYTTPDECRIMWNQVMSPVINRNPFYKSESRKLMELIKNEGLFCWDRIASKLNTKRNGFQCFYQYCRRFRTQRHFGWSSETQEEIVQLYRRYQDFQTVACHLSDKLDRINQHLVFDQYERICNPMLRKNRFTLVEDCILTVAMEETREILFNWHNFTPVADLMPWRYATILKFRADSLFFSWWLPWTIEEDRLLLKAVEVMGRNWSGICELFISNKDRKDCLARFRRLETKLRTESLEDFHKCHSNRYGPASSNSGKVEKIIQKLTDVYALQMTRRRMVKEGRVMWEKGVLNGNSVVEDEEISAHQQGNAKKKGSMTDASKKIKIKEKKKDFKFSCNRPPSENELNCYLLNFDTKTIKRTIKRLRKHINDLDFKTPMVVKKRIFDRRKFEVEVPQSVASALHFRKVRLIPQDEITDLTKYEEEIYSNFTKYCARSTPKTNCKRRLPTAQELALIPQIRRLIKKPQCAVKRKQRAALQTYSTKNLKLKALKDSEEESSNNEIDGPVLQPEADIHSITDSTGGNPDNTYCDIIAFPDEGQNVPTKSEFKAPKVKGIKGPKGARLRKLRSAISKQRWIKARQEISNTNNKTVPEDYRDDLIPEGQESENVAATSHEINSVEEDNLLADVTATLNEIISIVENGIPVNGAVASDEIYSLVAENVFNDDKSALLDELFLKIT